MPIVSQELLHTIRRIQIFSNQLATDLLAGAYHSAFKGKGMEFEEVREYQSGDDVRSIDWNVTARMDRPYVKNFREERELCTMLLIDVSASTRFGSGNRLKSDLIAEIGAVLAFSAIKNNDKVGLLLFSDIVEIYLPPRQGVRHVLRIIRELLAFQPKQSGSDLNGALSFLGKVQKKSGICFLISDFMVPDYAQAIKVTAKKYDLIALYIVDPYEQVFPNLHLVSLTDLETQEHAIVDTSAHQLQKQLALLAAQRLASNERLIKQIGAGFIKICTNQPYSRPIRKFFKQRGKRR